MNRRVYLYGLLGLLVALIWIAQVINYPKLGIDFVPPNWLMQWIEQVQRYQEVVQPPSLLPDGIALILICARLPWWAWVAAAQVVVFPISDTYSACRCSCVG